MKTNTSVRVLLLTGLISLSTPLMADEALDLLQKMRTAVQTLSYSGTLAYAQGNELATYQVEHKLKDGAEKGNVTRVSQGQGKPSGELENFSLTKFQQVQPNVMEKGYSFDVGAEDSIAGKTCRIVVARPRDRMRYLQRYCIDPTTGMLLKYSLIDRNHDTVEQLVFTTIEVDHTANNTAKTDAPTDAKSTDSTSKDQSSRWIFKNLPAGFEQVETRSSNGKDDKKREQLILSDGITSVSVFITTNSELPETANKGLEYSSGAMNIYTTKIEADNIVLVGEVPVATLKQIGDGMQHAK